MQEAVSTSNLKPDLIVVAPAWPEPHRGIEIALRSSLSVYKECFHVIDYLGCSELHDVPADTRAIYPDVNWCHVVKPKTAKAIRFLVSLTSATPAAAIRVGFASRLLQHIRTSVERSTGAGRKPSLIFEDIQLACFLPSVRKAFPSLPIAIRSQEVLFNGWCGIEAAGAWHMRMAWSLELAKIRRLEERVIKAADALWVISAHELDAYKARYGVSPDGVVGIAADVERYSSVPSGDARTVVSVGSADLRKGRGLDHFISDVWPRVRASVPDAQLILGGRDTERFTNVSNGISGLGFVKDDRDVLRLGAIFVNTQRIGAGVKVKSLVAMLAGKALLTTANGCEGLPGTNGADYVLADDAEHMARELLILMQQENAARRIGEQARRSAAQAYSIEAMRTLALRPVTGFAHLAQERNS